MIIIQYNNNKIIIYLICLKIENIILLLKNLYSRTGSLLLHVAIGLVTYNCYNILLSVVLMCKLAYRFIELTVLYIQNVNNTSIR